MRKPEVPTQEEIDDPKLKEKEAQELLRKINMINH
jgi:hypothetical protein